MLPPRKNWVDWPSSEGELWFCFIQKAAEGPLPPAPAQVVHDVMPDADSILEYVVCAMLIVTYIRTAAVSKVIRRNFSSSVNTVFDCRVAAITTITATLVRNNEAKLSRTIRRNEGVRGDYGRHLVLNLTESRRRSA